MAASPKEALINMIRKQTKVYHVPIILLVRYINKNQSRGDSYCILLRLDKDSDVRYKHPEN